MVMCAKNVAGIIVKTLIKLLSECSKLSEMSFLMDLSFFLKIKLSNSTNSWPGKFVPSLKFK